MTGSIRLEGLKELNNALKKLEAKVARKFAREGLKAAALVLRKEMRRRAPKKTGNLRKKIRFRLRQIRGGLGVTGRVGVASPKNKKDKSAFYARFIEYGTSPHQIPNKTVGRGRNKRKNKKKSKFGGHVYSRVNHPGQPARPFLRPAFESKKQEAVKAIGPKMWSLIKREAKR